MNLYAIKIGKKWVEVREASTRPVPIVTRFTHRFKVYSSTVYDGGRVLGCIKSRECPGFKVTGRCWKIDSVYHPIIGRLLNVNVDTGRRLSSR